MELRAITVLAASVCVLAAGATSASAATPVTVNGGWLNFSSGPVVPTPFPVAGNPFTFASNKPMVLEVTDAYCAGDQFRLTDNGRKLGDTNFVQPIGPCGPIPPVYITDPDQAYASKQYSHGTWTLQPGSHTISIVQIVNAFPTGTGAFLRVDTRKK